MNSKVSWRSCAEGTVAQCAPSVEFPPVVARMRKFLPGWGVFSSTHAGAVRHPVCLFTRCWGAKLPRTAKTTNQLRWVETIILVEGIVVVAWRRVKCVVCISANRRRILLGCQSGNRQEQQPYQRQNRNTKRSMLSYAFHHFGSLPPAIAGIDSSAPEIQAFLTTRPCDPAKVSGRLHSVGLRAGWLPLQRFGNPLGVAPFPDKPTTTLSRFHFHAWRKCCQCVVSCRACQSPVQRDKQTPIRQSLFTGVSMSAGLAVRKRPAGPARYISPIVA